MSLSLCSWLLLAVPAPAAVGTPSPKGVSQLHHGGFVSALAFTADGKTLLSASGDGLIRLWDPATGKERRRLQGHTGAVLSLALTPDGKRLASGGADRTVRFWDLEGAATEGRVLEGHRWDVTSVAFSRDGLQFTSADAVHLDRFTVL
jgi:WD40 repeat protein